MFKNKLILSIIAITMLLGLVLSFSMLSTQEEEQVSFGLNFDEEAYERLEWAVSPKLFRRDVEPLPQKVDMSERIPKAGNQGNQNSCVGWAVGYAYRSYQKLREDNRRWDYDEEYICSPAYIYNTLSIRRAEMTDGKVRDAGITVEEAMLLLRDTGCLPVSIMPYTDKDNSWLPQGDYDDKLKDFAIPSYQRLTKTFGNFDDNDLYQVRAALAGDEEEGLEGVPVEMSILVNHGAWNDSIIKGHETNNGNTVKYVLNQSEAKEISKTFWLERNKKTKTVFGHAVLIGGYDDEFTIEYKDERGKTVTEKGAFKILNSWGRDWADDGYFWMTYEAAKLTGMEAYRIGKNPDLPDFERNSDGQDMGVVAVMQAIKIRVLIEKHIFGMNRLISHDINYNDESGFFRVNYDFKIDDKFKLKMKFNDEYSMYVVNITPDGRLRELFPYPGEVNVSTWVYSGHEYSFPIRQGEVYTFEPEGPVGRELYVILISDKQLSMSDLTNLRQDEKIPDVDEIKTVEDIVEKAFPKIKGDSSIQIYPVILNTAE